MWNKITTNMENFFKHLQNGALTVIAILAIMTFSLNSYAAHPGKKQANTESVSKVQELSQSTIDMNNPPLQLPADDDQLILILLAFILPPVAVYMYFDEWNKTVTLNLILTLLCGLPGLIHALIVILGKK